MMSQITPLVLTFALAALLVGGCGNKDQTHGTSTRNAAVDAPAATDAKYTAYGEPMKLADKDALPVGQVLADASKYEGRYVRLVGNVNKVCERKGCWLEMADAKTNQAMFVKFTCPVEGRLIPMAAKGKPVVVEGIVQVKEISEADARHIKEESGAPPEEVAKIVGPQKQITLAAPAAQIAGM